MINGKYRKVIDFLKRKYGKLSLLLVVMAVVVGIFLFVQRVALNRDFTRIKSAGVLKVTCEYADGVYFQTDSGEVGFHYELAKAFAKSKGLELSVTPASSYEQMYKLIKEGECDMIASPIPMVDTAEKDSLLEFTKPVCINSLVLVQRIKNSEDSLDYVSNITQLENRTIFLPKSSPYLMRLENLQDEIGANINIKSIDKYGTEQLLAMVAHDNIDFTICDSCTARSYSKDYPQLDFSKLVSFSQFYSWAVYKSSKGLLKEFNAWLEKYKKTPEYKNLLIKYGFH